MKYTCYKCKEVHDDGLSVGSSRILKEDFEADGSRLSDTVPLCEKCADEYADWLANNEVK